MPFEFGAYTPTWVEWSITAAAFAAFVLIFAIFAKVMPLISIWEVAESERQKDSHKAASFIERLAPKEIEELTDRLTGKVKSAR
jgi:hypothetical protein